MYARFSGDRLVAVAGMAMFLDAMLFGILSPQLPHLAADLHLSTTESGILSGSFAVGAVLCAVPTGLLAGRIGGRGSLVCGLALMALASTAFAAGHSFVVLSLARFAQGAAGTAVWSGALTWVAGATPEHRRGSQLGLLIAIGITGTIFGPIAGALAVEISRAMVFGALPILCAVLAIALLPFEDARPQTSAGPVSVVWRRPALRTPALAGIAFAGLPAVAVGTLGVLAPLRLNRLGASATAIAVVFLLAAACETSVTPLAGRMSDRHGTQRILAVAALLLGGCFVLVAASDTTLLLSFSVLATFATVGLFTAPINLTLSAVMERAGTQRSHAFAAFNMCWAGGNMVGAVAGSALAEMGGYGLPELLLAGTAGLTAMLAGPRLMVPESQPAP